MKAYPDDMPSSYDIDTRIDPSGKMSPFKLKKLFNRYKERQSGLVSLFPKKQKAEWIVAAFYNYILTWLVKRWTYSNSGMPAYNVALLQAAEFCNKLSQKHDLIPAYAIEDSNMIRLNRQANGYRLPTEAEWEYAAKGGKNKDDYRYSGSNIMQDVAWHHHKTHRPAKAGLKQANSLGFHDMSGNVWELCWDKYYSNYPSDTDQRAVPSLSTEDNPVLRGSSHSYLPPLPTVTVRGGVQQYSWDDIGFRVVRNVWHVFLKLNRY